MAPMIVRTRRYSAAVAIVAALTAMSPPVLAQSWPTQTIRLITPYAPGGSNDVMARLIAPRLEKVFGQSVIVENRPGAGGQIGTEAVVRAAPDGHTLLLVASTFTVQPGINPKLPYDPEKDLAPVLLVNRNAVFFFVHPSVPANTMTEFVALAKKDPGKYNYASPGVGSQTQLTIELLSRRTGIKLQHVPYRGGAPATRAMLAGESHFTMLAPNVLFPYIEAGKLRPIANGDSKRHRRLPDVATTAEQGFKGIDAIQWVGVLAPRGTPRPVIDRLNAEINKILRMPDVIAVMDSQGVSLTGGTPEDFQALITREVAQWRAIAREIDFKLD